MKEKLEERGERGTDKGKSINLIKADLASTVIYHAMTAISCILLKE